MKSRSIFLMLFLLFTAFVAKSENSAVVTDQEKEQMKEQVTALIDKLVKGCEAANADSVMSVMMISPEFTYVVNRQSSDYQEFKKGVQSWFEMITSQKVTLDNERFSYPFFNSVLYVADLSLVMNYKNGRTVITDKGVWTLMFKKTGNDWKLIHGSEFYIYKDAPAEGAVTPVQ
ncbi:MAG: nuclear transport factor 2 family protein [Parabacteroides sp.]|nr:nuclear transport factor 2 family protein [Parabacteroides sp.]